VPSQEAREGGPATPKRAGLGGSGENTTFGATCCETSAGRCRLDRHGCGTPPRLSQRRGGMGKDCDPDDVGRVEVGEQDEGQGRRYHRRSPGHRTTQDGRPVHREGRKTYEDPLSCSRVVVPGHRFRRRRRDGLRRRGGGLRRHSQCPLPLHRLQGQTWRRHGPRPGEDDLVALAHTVQGDPGERTPAHLQESQRELSLPMTLTGQESPYPHKLQQDLLLEVKRSNLGIHQ